MLEQNIVAITIVFCVHWSVTLQVELQMPRKLTYRHC